MAVVDDALSLVQERMWLAERMAPNSAANSVMTLVPLVGPLDVDRLHRAIHAVVQRHEVLRTSYPAEAGKPRRRLSSELAIDLPIVDLERQPNRRSEVLRRASELAREPFDVTRGPLVRACVYRLDRETHVVAFALHYIVADSGSLGIFVREVAAFYGEIPPPPLEAQYAEVAVRQREAHASGTLAPEIEWWRTRLQGAPDLLELPSDRARPPVASLRSRQIVFTIPGQLAARVTAFARSERTTPFLVYLTAFSALVARWRDSGEVIVGAPVANRIGKDVTNLVGMFANTLVYRIDLANAASLRDALGRVQRTVLEANRHREVPFELLAEALLQGRPRQRSHAPIFQVVFNYMDASIDFGGFGDVRVQELPATAEEPQAISVTWWRSANESESFYDLFFTLSPTGDHVRCSLEYSADLFEPASIEAFVASYRDAVARLVGEPVAPLSSLALAPRLTWLAEAAAARARPCPIVVAANFTAGPIDEAIAFWARELGLAFVVEHAPFDQIFQQLVSSDSAFATNTRGVNVVLVRFDEWVGADVDRLATDLAAAVRASSRSRKIPHLVCVLSPTGEEILVRELRGEACVVTAAELAARYPVDTALLEHARGGIPFTQEYYVALGTMIVRKLLAQRRAPFKVIAVDADNTLWRGVVGEDGPANVVVGEAHAALQRALVAQAEQGALVCIVSKNEPADVEAMLAREDIMILQPSHVTRTRASWDPKPESLRALAVELDLALETFVFVDDSAVECAAMRAACPEVLVIQLPEESERAARVLEHVWALDRWAVTAEDAQRTAYYREQSAREALRSSLDLDEFVQKLELSVRIEPLSSGQVPRAAQLSARTTQFNVRPAPWTESEIRIDAPDERWLVTRASDRFGDYGIVGLVHARARDRVLEVDTFLLSCRALGRGIEHAMLARLAREAESLGLARVEIQHARTPRNAPAQRFLASIGGASLTIEQIDALPPWHRLAAPQRPALQLAVDETSQVATPPARTLPYERIATELADVHAIADAIARTTRRVRPASVAFVPPQTVVEIGLAELWQGVLGVSPIGLEDNFFELGGDSLSATIVLARIEQAFGADLPLAALLDRPTVADLARALDSYEADRAQADALGAALDELDQLSDEEVRALLAAEP